MRPPLAVNTTHRTWPHQAQHCACFAYCCAALKSHSCHRHSPAFCCQFAKSCCNTLGHHRPLRSLPCPSPCSSMFKAWAGQLHLACSPGQVTLHRTWENFPRETRTTVASRTPLLLAPDLLLALHGFPQLLSLAFYSLLSLKV